MESGYKKYVLIMVLCFLFGGYSLIVYVMQIYSIFWQSEIVVGVGREGGLFSIPFFSRDFNVVNFSESNSSIIPPDRRFALSDPYSMLFSPLSIMFLIAGLLSIFGGLAIWNLIREKEIRTTRKRIIDVFLLPDEKKIMDELEKYGGSLTQSELVKTTGLSRVKVHRIIRNLEKKNLIIKQQYGMTNKIVIKR